jgi:hypothetical protein
MNSQNSLFKYTLLAGSISGILVLSGCNTSGDSDKSQLRVIHTSPDAPAVNVKVDRKTKIHRLDYAQSSGFGSIKSGIRDIDVEAIIPGGNADVISVDNFLFSKNKKYTILAIDETSSIEPLIVDDSSASPKSDEVALVVVHASPAAADVDVYVTAPNADINSATPNFTFNFKESVDAGALDAGTYQIRVTAPGTKDVVYDSGPVDLSPFSGRKLLIAAISTTNDTTQSAAPIKLLVATPDNDLVLLDKDTPTGARVVHLSPDAGTVASGPVEVFASSSALPLSPAELIDAFEYTDIVPATDTYVTLPNGDYTFDVAVDGTGIGASVYTSPSLTLSAGSEYSVVAAGYVANSPAFGLLATEDFNRPIVTQASVKVVHAAPLAGSVDVFVTNAGDFTASDVENGLAGQPLLDDFTFGEITDYVPVAPGNYDIRVVAGGVAAINIENVNLSAGSVSTVIARQPDGDNDPSDFGVVVLTN